MSEYIVGRIYAKNYGYSIVAYNFYKCVKESEKSLWFQRLGKRWVRGDGQQGFVVCDLTPCDDKLIMVRKGGKFMGKEYHIGEELYEDHMD